MFLMFSKMTFLAAVLLLTSGYSLLANEQPTPLQLFDARIRPIFQSEDPSSCIQCHLSSVDLKDYILPSHQQTFASLKAQGLIDLTNPTESKILKLIQMGEKDQDQQAKLIHEQTRQAEYQAFAAWIESCCQDESLVQLPDPSSEDWAKPSQSPAVIRHTRQNRVLDSFERTVWSQRMRCFPCHTPYELDPNNPKHQQPLKKTSNFEGQYGKDHAQRLRLFRQTPEETLQYWIERSQQASDDSYPLINIDQPINSLILLKPTSKLPPVVDGKRQEASNTDPISHMGGLKMHRDDPSYKAWINWLEDYGKVITNKYQSVTELPKDNWYPSKHVVIIEDVPEEWPDLIRVQLLIHAWDQGQSTWQAEPIAFTQNSLTPKRRLVGTLFLMRPADETRIWQLSEETLPAGKYLLKVYIDSEQHLERQPTAMLTNRSFYGHTIIEDEWTKTFKQARKITGSQLKRE